MKLFFKINKENKLILLYSTGIKIRLRNEGDVDTYFDNKQDKL